MSTIQMPGAVGFSDGDMEAAGGIVIDLPQNADTGFEGGLGIDQPGVRPADRSRQVSAITQKVLQESGGESKPPQQSGELDFYKQQLGRQGNEIGELRKQNTELMQVLGELRGQFTQAQQPKQERPRMKPEEAYEYLGLNGEDPADARVARASLNVLDAAEMATNQKLSDLERRIMERLDGVATQVGGIGAAAKHGLNQADIDRYFEIFPEQVDLPTDRVYPSIAKAKGNGWLKNGGNGASPQSQQWERPDWDAQPVIVRPNQHVETGSGGVGAPPGIPERRLKSGVSEEEAFERFKNLGSGNDKLGVFTDMLVQGNFRM